jgi:hypothetical protein
MASAYQARWASKARAIQLRRDGRLHDAVLVDAPRGFIVVEPRGSALGDGAVLSAWEADFELNETWCLVPRSKLGLARGLLGLERAQAAATA